MFPQVVPLPGAVQFAHSVTRQPIYFMSVELHFFLMF
jgi:hypothetical protein